MIRNPLFSGAVIAVLLSVTMAACATGSEPAREQGLRAYGTQPGWILTLRPDHWVTLDTSFADHRYVIAVPSPEKDGDTRLWHASKKGLDLTLKLSKGACQDPSGDKQPFRAVVTVNGRTLEGCAHSL